MQVSFEFNQQLIPQSLVEVDEIGQFGLEAMNDDGFYYYMVVKTVLGSALVATCGPIIPDFMDIPNGFKISIETMPYKEDKLTKIINRFLNDGSKRLTQARTIELEEAIDQFRDVKDFISNYSGEL